MSDTRHHPLRMLVAQIVYWSIWGPAVAIALPFAITGLVLTMLWEDLVTPAVEFVRPAWRAAHELALRAGNGVLGFDPDA